MSIESPVMALALPGNTLGTKMSSMKSNGTILVCMMWLSQKGKNASRATGKTNSLSMAHRIQNMLATNLLRQKNHIRPSLNFSFHDRNDISVYTIPSGKTRDPNK